VTVVLTTQYLDEADQLAGRIAVLNHGRLVAEGTPEELKRMIPGGHVSLRLADAESLRRAELVLDGATADPAQLRLQVPSDGSVAALRGLLDRLDGAAIEVDTLALHTPDLDDVRRSRLGIALVGYVWAKRRTTAPDRAAVTRWCGPRDDAR